ncbi:MAG: adaptor protein MecA [Oscillospiraceae bacterium]
MILLTIEKLSNTAVKIIINKREMMRYGVCFETLNQNNSAARNMITEILKTMSLSTGINFTSARLFIEAFSIPENSCILYISIIEDDYEIYEPYISYLFEFGNISECIGFISRMNDEIRDSFAASRLYCNGEKTVLYADTAIEYEDYIVSSAAEFGAAITSGELPVQYAEEHFECLIKENAVQELYNSRFE